MRGKVVHPQQLNQGFFNRFMHDQIATDSALNILSVWNLSSLAGYHA